MKIHQIRTLLVATAYLATPGVGWAQAPPTEELDQPRKAGTYLQVGIAHGQGNLFRRSSLTQWDVALFGTNYDLVSAKLEAEVFFPETVVLLSGVSIGYRKDAVRRGEWGHMFSGLVFRDFDATIFAVKVAAGIEWGLPSLNFDQTEFAAAHDGTLRYRHTYMHRNADVPFVGTSSDGAVYPVVEVSILQRPGFLLFETGMRLGITRFNFDDFEVRPGDQLTFASGRRIVLVPYLFVDVGVRLF